MLDEAMIKRLLLRAASRDESSAAAFEALYRACAPLLLGIALRIVRRREVAEDVLHDAFVRIWNAAGSFDPLASQPVAWMAAIARNRALDVVSSAEATRTQSLHGNDDDDDPDGALDRLFDWSEPGADEAEDARRARNFLRDCLNELAAAERQTLVLAYSHGMSHSELAAHLARPLGTIKTWARRGMEALRECVEQCMQGAR
jgi:RNA polymerase sigma-70 factor (ECF subfamily)